MHLLCHEEKPGIIGLLETKVKKDRVDQIVGKMFNGWSYITNFNSHYNGYRVTPVLITVQVVSCEVFYVPLQMKFGISFVYAFNTREERKGL